MNRNLFITILILTFIGLKTYAHDFEAKGIYYNIISEKKVEVTYKGESTDSYSDEYIGAIKIPSSVSYYGTKYSVVAIGERAFYDCEKLTSVKIPKSVIAIDDRAFYSCKKITTIELPKSITTIGDDAFIFTNLVSIKIPKSVINIGIGAFSSCERLTSMIVEKGNRRYDSRNNCNAIIETASNKLIAGCKISTIPNTINAIGENAFWGLDDFISVSIPNSVTSIGENAFYSCGFTSINIPNSVSYIGKEAFASCSDLTWITIPNSVTMIGVGAFEGCCDLESIIVEKGNCIYDSRENCNAIIETASNKLIAGCRNTRIPNSVIEIGECAFDGQYYLSSITIPNSVNKIGEKAFYFCTELTSMSIPYSVSEIQERAFIGCKKLEYVTISNTETKCHSEAFEESTKIIRPTQELKSERNNYNWNYITNSGNRYGANSTNGEVIVPAKYTKVEYMPYYDGYFIVWSDGCSGIYNTSGQNLIPVNRGYSSIVKTCSDGRYYYRVCKGGKYGACDINGREIVAPHYTNIILYDGVFLYKDYNNAWTPLNIGLNRENAVVNNPLYVKQDVTYYDMALEQSQLEESFGKNVKTEQIISTIGKRAIKVTFDDKILFEFGKYDLNVSALNYIDKVAEALIKLPSTKVKVTGYTDNVGTFEANSRLSLLRAEAVRDQLVRLGIDYTRISADGVPLANYIATNESESGRALNRRVEIVIEPME